MSSTEDSQIHSRPHHQPYKVLIVDDESTHRALEKEVLSGEQFTVTEAGNGEEALARLCEQEFDVVLADKRMPGMDGDELCQRIRADLNLSLMPVIMVTASNSRDDLLNSLNSGANDFIRKPYNPLELVARTSNFAAHKRLTDQMENAETLLFALARMVEARDEHTGNHCSRLAHTSVVIGEALGLGTEELTALRRGGVLHDIGKLGIPDSILLKNGPLNENEWMVMRTHTIIGSELLNGLKSMQMTLPIVRNHHERWDGGGYPDGLKGADIPLLARIFQVADIYDALAHARPYKAAMSHTEIAVTIEEETVRGWRDPELTSLFLDILRQRPEDLSVSAAAERDMGTEIFENILRTGALTWNDPEKTNA
ncbi:MAG: response regulator [Gammaproteobacteria bacterium]|nr:response regulator [Gammaproteobacteria bacterium]